MKMTKSYKIVLLLTTFVLVVTAAFCSLFSKAPADADSTTATNASDYFTGFSSSQLKFDGGYLVATVKENSEIADEVNDEGLTDTVESGVLNLANAIAINDLEMVFVIPDGLKSFTLVLNGSAYYANGNVSAEKDGDGYKKADGEYVYKTKTTISNEIDFDFVSGTAKVNGASSGSAFRTDGGKLSVKTSVTSDGYVKFIAGSSGTVIVATDIVDGSGKLIESKKIKNVADTSVANVKFMFELKDADAPVDFKIESVDQKASDANGNYKQTFETDENGVIIDDGVYPVVALSDSFYKKNSDFTYSAIKNLREKYTLSVSVYSVFGGVSSSDIYIQKNDGVIWRETNDTPKGIMFLKEGTFGINLVAKDGDNEIVYKTVSVEVRNFANDDESPVYVYDEAAYQAFEVALENAYYDIDGGHYAALGSDMEIPSMKDLVFDDYVTYEGMTKTVYYDNNSSADLSSSGMTISLSEAGKYVFKVVFADGNGNVMDKDNDFESGEIYEKFVFDFKIDDDAPIKITAAPSQGVGYKGVTYTASKFTIDAVGCTTTYTLYYNANMDATEDSEGWIEIPKSASVTDTEYSKDGYTYDDVQAIGYNGTLTFTPDKSGAYMIKCSTVSSVTSRGDEATTIVKVEKSPVTVKVYTDWLKNNVWSVVFLSIGTLCLIGIIVLLCIKPKDETESD